jgi:hypothetical protein
MDSKRKVIQPGIIRVLEQALILGLLLITVGEDCLGRNKETEQHEQARKLWEAALTAKGGRDRLRSVSSLYIESTYPDGSGDRGYDLYIFPDRTFSYSYWARFERTDIGVYNGRHSIRWWQRNDYPGKAASDIEDAAEYLKEAQFTYLMVTRWLEPKPLRVRKEWIGLKRVDVVETDVDGWRVDYYLDARTHLPIKVASAQSKISRAEGKLNREVSLDDYAEVDGIMMPQKLTVNIVGIVKSHQRAKYELNVDYDERIFERAPIPGMKPDAWRRVARPLSR